MLAGGPSGGVRLDVRRTRQRAQRHQFGRAAVPWRPVLLLEVQAPGVAQRRGVRQHAPPLVSAPGGRVGQPLIAGQDQVAAIEPRVAVPLRVAFALAGLHGTPAGRVPIGIDAPQAAVNLRSDSAMAVLGALGIPPQLFHAGGTTPIHEALRTWMHTGITPLAELIAEELTRKLGVRVALDFSRLYASDITSRSRALGQMVKAGMDLDEARRLSGLS